MNEIEFESGVQLLVDGELPHKERTQLLLNLKSEKDSGERWQQIALAFIEQQIIKESLSGRSSATARPQKPDSNTSNHCPAVTLGQRQSKPNLHSIVLAAGLIGFLLSGFTGFLIGNWGPASDTIPTVASDQEVTIESDSKMTLADAIARSSRPIPPSFRREMLKAGYLVNEDLETTSVELPIGGSIDIPIRKINIQFLGIAAYQ